MQTPSQPEDHLPQRLFPAEAAAAERPVRAAGPGFFPRYVLPVALFVIIVGITAWVVQNMPKWRTPTPMTGAAVATPEGGKPLLEFTREKARWDKDSDLVRETERGVPGHYDFPFRNVSGQAVEFGLLQPSCDCVSIEAALLPSEEWMKIDKALTAAPGAPAPYGTEPAWQKLAVRASTRGTPSADEVLHVPAAGEGVVRVHWNGRKDPGRQLNLTPKFWSQPQGQPELRYDKLALTVPVKMVQVIQAFPAKAIIGSLAKGGHARADFYIWSVTRDDLNLKVLDEPPSPLFDVQTRRLTPADFPTILSKLADENQEKPRIRAAFHVTVMVYEAKGGAEMDLGPFLHKLQLLVDEVPNDLTLQVYGIVRGDVEVGGSEDQGKIKLKPFSVKQGTREVLPLWTDAKVALEPQQAPPGVEVKLTKVAKESTTLRTKWRLEVVIPPETIAAGTFGDDYAVILRISGNPPRLVRIPLVGHALAGNVTPRSQAEGFAPQL